jgi:hypothetical protein
MSLSDDAPWKLVNSQDPNLRAGCRYLGETARRNTAYEKSWFDSDCCLLHCDVMHSCRHIPKFRGGDSLRASPWRCRCVPPKCRYLPTRTHGGTVHMAITWIYYAVETTDFTSWICCTDIWISLRTIGKRYPKCDWRSQDVTTRAKPNLDWTPHYVHIPQQWFPVRISAGTQATPT